ncbi:MAG TPA: glycosyltransferase family 39 protein [Solirubrobacter sp.]|nr:glycosyltransferase family 39 protein [Solirubrobacter sp.]
MSAASQRGSLTDTGSPGRGTSHPSGEARLRDRGTRWPWILALGALFVGALIVRLIGLKTGLPYVYNADENSHFVPRAIGMFGHSLNPDYFINPPAFTYVIHALFAVRWGTDPASVGGAFGMDPTEAFTIARGASAFLGALAVPLTAIAGARLFEDRRVGFVAGALLAVAFLPVHYSHFALNDAPTLAPLALCLVGVAGIYRTGRVREYVLAGIALGVAIATKYTAGIVLVTVIAAAFASPVAHARVRNLALAVALMCAGFVAANPYALLDRQTFWEGIRKQTETAGEEGGKLGLANSTGWTYYLGTFTWGFGWLPSLLALGGIGGLIARHRRLAIVLAPAPILLLAYLGEQSRFFARWMLPIYPILAILAAWALVALATRLKSKVVLAVAAALVLAQGAVYSVHNGIVLARDDTRQVARDWMVEHIPPRTKIVVEPIAPDQWASDPGGFLRWNKFRTSRSCYFNGQRAFDPPCPVVKLEDYERSIVPQRIDAYEEGGYCWVLIGSTQFGRAYADPDEVPAAIRYYEELARRGDVVFRVSPYGSDRERVPFSFDFSFNAYPLAYERPGPEVIIYRLRGGDCAT